MPRGSNQKFKLFYLAKIMLSMTDNEHYITMPEIISELSKYGVSAERKTLYNDLKDLEQLGIEIEGEPIGKSFHYHVIGRIFELPELKLLVDSIQSSKFITEKKSNELIGKLEQFVSIYEAKNLQRQVYISGRIKTVNEAIYYNVDAIHDAINDNKKIKFQYFNWNTKKEMVLRHDGAYYKISPWGVLWDDENYYLVGYDSSAAAIKHYRVDKMLHIDIVDEEREGKHAVSNLNMADYARKSFNMFSADERMVKIRFKNDFAGVVIDRFGGNIMMIPDGKEYFIVNVVVQFSKQFIHWVLSLGDGAKIIGPDDVVKKVIAEIERSRSLYI